MSKKKSSIRWNKYIPVNPIKSRPTEYLTGRFGRKKSTVFFFRPFKRVAAKETKQEKKRKVQKYKRQRRKEGQKERKKERKKSKGLTRTSADVSRRRRLFIYLFFVFFVSFFLRCARKKRGRIVCADDANHRREKHENKIEKTNHFLKTKKKQRATNER